MSKNPYEGIPFGVIYVASGERYVEEAAVSAESLKRKMPEIPILIFSDQETAPPVFDEIRKLEDVRGNCYDKVRPLLETPFEKTLFLDTDTYVCRRIDEISTLLDRFDLLVSHTPYRDPNPLKGIPSAFPEFNTGVIGFRRSESFSRFLEKWIECYADLGMKADQPAFRKVLWEDRELRSYILTPEYNFRTIFPGYVGGGSAVKIIHGRHKDWDKIDRKLNRYKKPRVLALSPLSLFNGEVIILRSILDLLKSLGAKLLRRK